MLAFSNDYYGLIFRATQSVELFCAYSKLDIFYDFIIQCLESRWSKSKTIKEIYAKGYTGSKSNAFEYLCKVEQKENKYFEAQPYIRTMTEGLKYRTGSIGKEKDYITREGIFR